MTLQRIPLSPLARILNEVINMNSKKPDLQTVLERLEKQNRSMRQLIGFLLSLFIFSLIFFLSGGIKTLAAQKPSELYLEGQAFTLGMQKREALERLAECCRVNGDFIISKNGPPYRQAGAIHFENEKVTWLVKHHGQYQGTDSVEFAMKLYQQIWEIGKSGTVHLSARIEEGAGADWRYVDIVFPSGKLLRITIGKVDKGPIREYVDLTEELHAGK
jgi:hypothetical protein